MIKVTVAGKDVPLDHSRTLAQSCIRAGATLKLKSAGLLGGMPSGGNGDEISMVGELVDDFFTRAFLDSGDQEESWVDNLKLRASTLAQDRQDQPSGRPAGCFAPLVPRTNFRTFLRTNFRDYDKEARRFLNSKSSEMSHDHLAAQFCENSIRHEATSSTARPYPGFQTNCAFVGTYPVAGNLMRCATFRHLLKRMDLVPFEMPIVDALTYIHRVSAGKFVFTEDLVRHTDVLAWFRLRLTKMVYRMSVPEIDAHGSLLTRLTPVIYVCREVFFAIEEWQDMKMQTVLGLSGIVFKTAFRGFSLIIIKGKHFSPRGWAGEGKYREYHFYVNVYIACLRNPDDPVTALAEIDAEELIRVQAMQAFFVEKQVPVDKLQQLRPSCLHRSLELRRESWDAIQFTIDKIAPTMTSTLPPELIALLSLQMDDLENIPAAIASFGHHLAGRIHLTEPGEVLALMRAVVKHSNALAFRVDSALEITIEERVDRLIQAIRGTLGVSDENLAGVLKGITAEATREDSFELVAQNLRDVGLAVEDWATILSTPGAVKAISRGKLVQVTDV